jgi:hypothetical protein
VNKLQGRFRVRLGIPLVRVDNQLLPTIFCTLENPERHHCKQKVKEALKMETCYFGIRTTGLLKIYNLVPYYM